MPNGAPREPWPGSVLSRIRPDAGAVAIRGTTAPRGTPPPESRWRRSPPLPQPPARPRIPRPRRPVVQVARPLGEGDEERGTPLAQQCTYTPLNWMPRCVASRDASPSGIEGAVGRDEPLTAGRRRPLLRRIPRQPHRRHALRESARRPRASVSPRPRALHDHRQGSTRHPSVLKGQIPPPAGASGAPTHLATA